MKIRAKLSILLLALLIAGPAIYWQKYRVTAEQPYRMQAAIISDIAQTVSANGTINPVSLISVGTQVSGTVKRLYVDFNSKVEKNQVLLELDDSLLAAQHKQSLASVQSALAMVELCTANEDRLKTLYAQQYVSTQELDSAIQARKAAQAQLQMARATVERDSANLAYAVIRSPVSGVVVDRAVDVGQTVAASLQTPTLFKIAQDLSRMQIDSNFAEADIGSIQVGQKVRFNVDAFAERRFQGIVRQIRLNPTTVSNVVTYDVVIDVANPEQRLLPGMTAYVNIAVAERKGALLVPNAALRFKANQKRATGETPRRDGVTSRVYKLEKGELVPINVSAGITDNRNTEITAGELKAGDQLVIGEMEPADKAKNTPPMRLF